MNDYNIETLRKIPIMNALQTARAVLGKDSTLFDEINADCENSTIIDLINKACVNPYFRMMIYGRDVGTPISRLVHNYTIKVGSMKSALFKWLVDATEAEYVTLQDMCIFVDLDVMQTFISNAGKSGNSSYDTKYGKVTVNFETIMSIDNLRGWYEAYAKYRMQWLKPIREDISKRYAALWNDCKRRFGDMVPAERLAVSVDTRFGSFELDALKDYLSAWEGGFDTLLGGSDYKRPITDDLDYMLKALKLKNEGIDEMKVYIHDRNTGEEQEYVVSVSAMLSTVRLRKFADGYTKYAAKQVEYIHSDANESWDEDFARFLKYFPGRYEPLINYMYDTVCTDEEKVRSVVPSHLRYEVEDLLPDDWEDMRMEDLREALRNAVSIVMEN